MAIEWKKVRLGELYEVHNGLSKGGKFFGSGYPFLSFSTIFNNFFIPENIKDLVQSTPEEQENYSVKAGDVFVTRTSETADELGMSCVALKDYPNATYNGFCKRLRPIDSEYKVLPKYIGYYLRTPEFRGKFLGLSGSMTTRASLKNDDLLSMIIPLPPLETQQKIAGILSAYDDLIENNRKQIKLLEEAAQKLYKEWFVKLNFPGHENVKIVDGVPEGWKKVTIEELLSEHFNGGWGKETITGNYKNLGLVIRGTDINDIEQGNYSKLPLRYHPDKDIKNKILHHGDIIFELSNGNINNIGRTLLVTDELLNTLNEPVICASFCKLFRPKNWNYSILLKREIQDMQISKRLLPYKKNGANGINNFAFNDFLNHELLIPENNSKLYFYLENYEKAKNQVQKKLSLLQSARDRLLPKLMTGELI